MDKAKAATYLEVVCEARLNSTEKQETIEDLVTKFIPGEPMIDDRFDGTYIVVRNSGFDSLQIFGEWVRQQQILDTVRYRLKRSITGNLTALYFNRQAAAMGRLSLIDVNDSPPNGPVVLQIVSDGLEAVIDEVTPKTWKGKELTDDQWQKLQEQRERNKQKKKQERDKIEEYKEKYNSS